MSANQRRKDSNRIDKTAFLCEKKKMADSNKSARSLVSEYSDSDSEPDHVASKDSMNNKIIKMWEMQHKNNVQLQNQMIQVLTTMAAQQVPAETASPSSKQCAPSQEVHTAVSAHIKLSTFDPDDTPFTMTEWMDEVTRIQQEFGLSDTLIVLKAGDALRGRAARFYKHWKPIARDWVSFRRDFEVAFPEQGTAATRVRACLAIKSSDFSSLVEYGNAKLAAIKRFYANFPWHIILSLLEYDVQNSEVKNRICLQAPSCETDLLKLLAVCDARTVTETRAASNNYLESRERSRKRHHNHPYHSRGSRSSSVSSGKCRKCHQYGHIQADCKQWIRSTFHTGQDGPSSSGTRPNALHAENNKKSTIVSCNYCKKPGHTEETCYRKQGNSNRVMLKHKSRFIRSFPNATITHDTNILSISYLVDTAADVSILHENVAKTLI